MQYYDNSLNKALVHLFPDIGAEACALRESMALWALFTFPNPPPPHLFFRLFVDSRTREEVILLEIRERKRL